MLKILKFNDKNQIQRIANLSLMSYRRIVYKTERILCHHFMFYSCFTNQYLLYKSTSKSISFLQNCIIIVLPFLVWGDYLSCYLFSIVVISFDKNMICPLSLLIP